MSDSSDNDNDGLVGYGKPPSKSRFRPGQSGNPAGRPKGSLNVVTILMRTLREKVLINENGRRTKITKLEASLKQLVNKAASGDLRAFAHLLAMLAAEQSVTQDNVSDDYLNQPDREVFADLLERYGQFIKQEGNDESKSD